MSRDLTSAVQSEVEKTAVEAFLLAELEFDSNPVYAWNGYGTLTWNATDYTGVGWFGGIEPTKETSELQARGLKFSLSGVPSALLSLALGQDYHNRIARIRLGFMAEPYLETESGDPITTESGERIEVDQESQIIADPVVLNEGLMDQMVINEGPETSTISVSAESRLIALERPNRFLYDDEGQKALYPNDRGFEFVAALQDKDILWGVGVSAPNFPRVIHDRISPEGGGGR